VLVLGANLALDRTLRIAQLVPGHVQRPSEVVATGGGKSVNVLRAARAHDARGTLVANLPGRLGAHLGALVAEEGHDVVAVPTAGEARCAIIVLEASGRVTVVNEPGPPLAPQDAESLLAALDVAAPSVPPAARSASWSPRAACPRPRTRACTARSCC
jgi:fructose-1-phosphate kinase PfkB-like protein